MLIFKLAFRNIIARGLRTWLNVVVLSIAFVTLIWMQGLFDGMNEHVMKAMIQTQLGGGQFWHEAYDPFDPLTIEDARAPLSPSLTELVEAGKATPILITSGAIYPDGRVQTALLKGIDPHQRIVNIPSENLKTDNDDVILGLIGTRMAEHTHLRVGDYVTVRWRDAHGTFDAADVQIVHIMSTTVSAVDAGQIWLPLETLREMLGLPGEATYLILNKTIETVPSADAVWKHRDLDFLLSDLRALVKSKKIGSSIFYTLLLSMALLAIFDTQVLSVFKRRREIGMLMALGMHRLKVINLFTLEGALHGIMALFVGAIYGIPLMWYMVNRGLPLPKTAGDFGIALPSALYSTYSAGLLLWTTLLVLITVTIVSFLPTRRITKLKPTDALRGKMS
ncbi:ABC transporter permease [candidate division LCP-89 bacterium B3_LCP]|uniref:ABC transporter permease n=1 Tax=candidate division LCP-89 bacterium B3_LCP TaxID=2012998 RepID=A0A532V1S2_UNCL8|nr:MAG: ABC transporter permease [candidate division LCP-89 bacterium B3_LCP]